MENKSVTVLIPTTEFEADIRVFNLSDSYIVISRA